jgi:hypothetical protein
MLITFSDWLGRTRRPEHQFPDCPNCILGVQTKIEGTPFAVGVTGVNADEDSISRAFRAAMEESAITRE